MHNPTVGGAAAVAKLQYNVAKPKLVLSREGPSNKCCAAALLHLLQVVVHLRFCEHTELAVRPNDAHLHAGKVAVKMHVGACWRACMRCRGGRTGWKVARRT